MLGYYGSLTVRGEGKYPNPASSSLPLKRRKKSISATPSHPEGGGAGGGGKVREMINTPEVHSPESKAHYKSDT